MELKNFKLTNGTRGYVAQQILEMDLTEPKRLDIGDYAVKRGLSANALGWVWYKTIGDEFGMTTDEVHADCKIRFGIPILFKSQDDYAHTINTILERGGFYQMSLEDQWRYIQPIAVTSKFTTKQMSQYLEDIQRFYGIQGLHLESM